MDNKHGAADMIDPADKQTTSLPLEQPKRGRGRPSTGKAMTPAEKQKAYRERMKNKSNVTVTERDEDNQVSFLRKLLKEAENARDRLATKVTVLEGRLESAETRLKSRVTENGEYKEVWYLECKSKGRRNYERLEGGICEEQKITIGQARDWLNRFGKTVSIKDRLVSESGLIMEATTVK